MAVSTPITSRVTTELEQAARTILTTVGIDPDRPVHPDGRTPWQQLLDSALALDRTPLCRDRCKHPLSCAEDRRCYANL